VKKLVKRVFSCGRGSKVVAETPRGPRLATLAHRVGKAVVFGAKSTRPKPSKFSAVSKYIFGKVGVVDVCRRARHASLSDVSFSDVSLCAAVEEDS
jgi:hypothetical protein